MWQKVVFWGLVVFLAVLMRCGLLYGCSSGLIIPDFVLMVVVFCGLYLGPQWGTGIGLGAGFLIDSLSLPPAGQGLAFYGFVGLFSGHLGKRIYASYVIIVSILVFFFNLLGSLLQWAVFCYMSPAGVFSQGMLRKALSETLVSTATSIVVFLFLRKLSSRLRIVKLN